MADVEVGRLIATLGLDSSNLERDLAVARNAMDQVAQKVAQLDAALKAGTITAAHHAAAMAAIAPVISDLNAKYDQLIQTQVEAIATSGKLSVAMGGVGGGARGASMGLLQLSYAIDDIQYGFKAIVNNIPQIVMAFGGGPGLAGGIGIAAVAANVFLEHAEELNAAIKSIPDGASNAGDALKGLGKIVEGLTERTKEYLGTLGAIGTKADEIAAKAEEGRKKVAAGDRKEVDQVKGREEAERAHATDEALKEAGGGKELRERLVTQRKKAAPGLDPELIAEDIDHLIAEARKGVAKAIDRLKTLDARFAESFDLHPPGDKARARGDAKQAAADARDEAEAKRFAAGIMRDNEKDFLSGKIDPDVVRKRLENRQVEPDRIEGQTARTFDALLKEYHARVSDLADAKGITREQAADLLPNEGREARGVLGKHGREVAREDADVERDRAREVKEHAEALARGRLGQDELKAPTANTPDTIKRALITGGVPKARAAEIADDVFGSFKEVIDKQLQGRAIRDNITPEQARIEIVREQREQAAQKREGAENKAAGRAEKAFPDLDRIVDEEILKGRAAGLSDAKIETKLPPALAEALRNHGMPEREAAEAATGLIRQGRERFRKGVEAEGAMEPEVRHSETIHGGAAYQDRIQAAVSNQDDSAKERTRLAKRSVELLEKIANSDGGDRMGLGGQRVAIFGG